jgi:hypothetical protein
MSFEASDTHDSSICLSYLYLWAVYCVSSSPCRLCWNHLDHPDNLDRIQIDQIAPLSQIDRSDWRSNLIYLSIGRSASNFVPGMLYHIGKSLWKKKIFIALLPRWTQPNGFDNSSDRSRRAPDKGMKYRLQYQ